MVASLVLRRQPATCAVAAQNGVAKHMCIRTFDACCMDMASAMTRLMLSDLDTDSKFVNAAVSTLADILVQPHVM